MRLPSAARAVWLLQQSSYTADRSQKKLVSAHAVFGPRPPAPTFENVNTPMQQLQYLGEGASAVKAT